MSMIRCEIEVEVSVMAKSRADLGRLTDRVVEYVGQLIEDDPNLKFTGGISPTCVATIRDRAL